MSIERKEESVSRARESLRAARVVAVVEHFGIPGPSMDRLRREARRFGWTFQVIKNTLARRALSQSPQAGLIPWLSGPTALLTHPDADHPALRWLVEEAHRALPRTPPEWERFVADRTGFRQQWRTQQAQKAGSWAPLPRPGGILRVRGAWLVGHILDEEALAQEARLDPTTTHTRLLGVLNEPARRLLGTLQAGPQKLTRLLQALQETHMEP